MSFIAWPSWCSLEAQWGAEREPRNPKRTQADPPGRAMSRGFPFLPRADYSPVLAFHAELHNRAGFCTGRSDLQCVTQREGKSPVPFSKLETYPGGWGFYPLSILCLNPFGKDHSIRDDRIQSRGWPLASQIDSGVSKIW